MSVTYESPTRYLSDTESNNNGKNNVMYSISSNENDGSPCTSPFNASRLKIPEQQHQQQLPSASHLNQEFFNALQKRQNNFQSSTGSLPQTYRHQHLEDLAPIESENLNELMTKYDCHQVLVIDVRSFAFYAKNRIKSAIHISIPSVLLKRPTYTLDKICESIVFEEAANRLKNWHRATHIIFYDHASYKPSDSGNSATAILLGSKLRKSGYSGQLNYLQGKYFYFFDMEIQSVYSTVLIGGYAAFSNTYPHQCELAELDSINQTKRHQTEPISLLPTSNKAPAVNPFFSNIRQNLELSHGPLEERFPVRLPYGSKNDNGIISTTSHHSAISNHHPRFGLAGSSVDAEGNFVLPIWLKAIMKNDTGPKKLAEKYEVRFKDLLVLPIHSNDIMCCSNWKDLSKIDYPLS